MKINKKNIILGLEWLSFQCGEYMGDLQKDRCEISDIPQEYIDLFKDIDTGDSDPDEPLERFIDCPQCHKESGCYVRKNGFAECKHCGYYLLADAKIYVQNTNKDGKYVGTESCDKCGGDGFIEYDNSSKKEGEVIESYDSEECNKCNGKGTV